MKGSLDSSMKITAIICTHNRSDVLPKAIESLLSQSISKDQYEILVIDNASTDNTNELCKKYATYGNFRYVFEPVPGLSTARNTGMAEAKGQYVAYMDDDAIASDHWLETLLSGFETVTPSPASVGGKIEPIWEAPKPDWLPDQKKPYLTILDYGVKPVFLTYPKILYGTNMAFTKEALVGIGGFRTDVGRVKHCLLSGEEMEVYRQLAEKELPVYYLPSASVRHLVPKNRLTKKWLYTRHYWQGRSEVLVLPAEMSRQSLGQEFVTSVKCAKGHCYELINNLFKQVSPTFTFSHTASLLQQLGRIHQLTNKVREPESTTGKQRMLILARSLPRYDRGSGHLRLYHILEILAPHYDISYFTENYSSNEECNDERYVAALSSLGIEVVKDQANLGNLIKKNYDIVFFEFYDTAIRHFKRIKESLPNASTVIDTVDVHFAREMQMANVHQDLKLLQSALETKRKELDIYQKCDLIWAVTDEDRSALHQEIPSLKVDVVPNIHKFTKINRDDIEKNSLLFIGNFWHQPNEDAVVYFCREILPLIKKDIPDIVFYIVGNAPTQTVKELADETVKVIGWVPETTPYLEKCHISIVPLRYGAGMKGKVGEAMSAGIPVVTTPIGVQGMDVSYGNDILVSESAEAFAYNVKQLLRDEKLYSHVSSNAMRYIKERYDFNVVASSVVASIQNAPKPLTKRDFGYIGIMKLLWTSFINRGNGSNVEAHKTAAAVELTEYADKDAATSFSGIGGVEIYNVDEEYEGERVIAKLIGSSSPGPWSFGYTDKYKLAPGLTYIFTGSMLISKIDESTSFFKCELYNGAKWLQNFDSDRYDISQKGKWQKLCLTLTIPSDISPVIRIAVEKRPNDKTISAEILIGAFQLVSEIVSSEG